MILKSHFKVIISFVVCLNSTWESRCQTTQAMIETGTEKLFLAHYENPKIYTSSLSATGPTSLTEVTFDGSIGEPLAIDYDPVEDFIYWIDVHFKKIHRARYNGTGHETIVDLVRKLSRLSIDVESRRMFWTDYKPARIEVAYLNGTERSSIVTDVLNLPYDIVADSLHGWIFWTDFGNDTIERARMDGSNRQIIIESGLASTFAIAVDAVGNILYWCDSYYQSFEKSDLSGNFREVLIDDYRSGLSCLTIAIHAEYIYWMDSRNGLQRFNRYNTGSVIELVDLITGTVGLHVYQVDECASSPCQNNGTCHDFFKSFQCICPAGFIGILCEDVDECASSPCQNNGFCNDTFNSFHCTCPEGFTGTLCEEEMDAPSVGLHGYMIALIIVCVLVLVMLPASILFCWFYYSRTKKRTADTISDDQNKL